jgi:hypothetical protein
MTKTFRAAPPHSRPAAKGSSSPNNTLRGVSEYILINHVPIEFDHASRDIEVFNSELTLLLNHFKQLEDKQLKREFVDKMTYVVELLHKNQAIKNTQTHARVKIRLSK